VQYRSARASGFTENVQYRSARASGFHGHCSPAGKTY